MTTATLTRILIGGTGMLVGASVVLTLRGAAIAGAQRLEVAQARTKATVTAYAAKTPMQDVAATDRPFSYPRM